MAHIASVQARLVESQRNLQREIDALQVELKQNQDPTRMHLIQEMISVRVQVATTHTICHISRFTGSFWSNVPHTRKSNRVGGCCTKHHEGHSSTRSRKEKSYPQHDNFEKTANARCVRIPTSQHGSLKYHAVNALTQLEDFVREKKYADVAQTLAVRILRNLSPRTRLTAYRRSNRYPFPSNLTLPSSVSHKFGDIFKNFKANFGHTSTTISMHCKLSLFR